MTVYIYISNYQCSIAVIKLQFRQFAALQQVPPGVARTPRTPSLRLWMGTQILPQKRGSSPPLFCPCIVAKRLDGSGCHL